MPRGIVRTRSGKDIFEEPFWPVVDPPWRLVVLIYKTSCLRPLNGRSLLWQPFCVRPRHQTFQPLASVIKLKILIDIHKFLCLRGELLFGHFLRVRKKYSSVIHEWGIKLTGFIVRIPVRNVNEIYQPVQFKKIKIHFSSENTASAAITAGFKPQSSGEEKV